MIDNFSG